MEMTIAVTLEVLGAAMLLLLLLLLLWLRRPRRLSDAVKTWPGPPALPLLGNALQLGTNSTDLYYNLGEMCKDFYGTPFKVWVGNRLNVVLTVPKDIEILLGSSKLIDKSYNYQYAQSWLGTGLLTSTGSKWHRRRKILTPTFHFKILEDFVDVFHANGGILIDRLRRHIDGPGFDIHHYISLNALDNICETAMGIQINAQNNVDSEYVKAVNEQKLIVMERSFKPWLQPDLIFNLTSLKRTETKALKILHGTTNEVIRKRRQEIQDRPGAGRTTEDGIKRRLAFLDLLMEGSQLTDEDIREEVDTFMFEGHDTTSAGIAFALWLLSWHQDIQQEVVQEVAQVWSDPKQTLTYHKLQDLKLLERVIREAQRLYPSVPIFARELSEDTLLSGGLVAPKGANAVVAAYMVHKDPEMFPDPEKFDPDRFLPENAQGRHPYAYIPFSAGPRNCIGQKFAMLEMKCTLAHVLRAYKFSPASSTPSLKLSSDMILAAKDGVPVYIETR